MAELEDALDLGSSPLQADRGSTPLSRTKIENSKKGDSLTVSQTTATVKIDEISQVIRKLQFDVPWDEIKKELDIAYAKLSKTSKIKGFRPGKVPRPILETYYKAKAEEETVYNIINRCYFDSLKKNGIDALTQPKIEQGGISPDKNFTFTATVEVPPVIDPVGYTGLNIKKTVRQVKDEDIDNVLQQLRKSLVTFKDAPEEHLSAADDYLTFDYQVSIDGKLIDELAAVNTTLQLNQASTLPAFEEQLLGLKVGAEKEFTVTYPQDYHDSTYAGKTVSFQVKIKQIQEQILPEMDDNFIKNFQQHSSLEELLTGIRKSLEAQYEQEANAKFEREVLDELMKINEFEVPPSMIESQAYFMMQEQARYLMSRGMPKEQAVESSYNMYSSLKPEAVRILKSMYLLDAIQAKEAIEVNNEEIDSSIGSMALARGEDPEGLKKMFQDTKRLEQLKNQLQHNKVLKYIEDHAIIDETQTINEKGDTP